MRASLLGILTARAWRTMAVLATLIVPLLVGAAPAVCGSAVRVARAAAQRTSAPGL